MIHAWSTLSREQKRVWTAVTGAILVGTAFKVAYFSFSRSLIVSDTKRQQLDGVERLREAREFAEWSRKDREARFPKLNPEQREQMRQYLQLVEQHGLRKSFEATRGEISDADCVGCPVLGQARKAAAAVTGPGGSS